MKGRPKRRADNQLALRARSFEAREAISARKAALRLGLDPATYARSMKLDAFSEQTRRTLEAGLTRAGVEALSPTKEDFHVMVDQILHLMVQVFEMLGPFSTQAREQDLVSGPNGGDGSR